MCCVTWAENKRARGDKGKFVIHIDPDLKATMRAPPKPPRFVLAAQESSIDPRLTDDPEIWGEPYGGPAKRLAVTRDLVLTDQWTVPLSEYLIPPCEDWPGLPNDVACNVLPLFLGQSHVVMLAM